MFGPPNLLPYFLLSSSDVPLPRPAFSRWISPLNKVERQNLFSFVGPVFPTVPVFVSKLMVMSQLSVTTSASWLCVPNDGSRGVPADFSVRLTTFSLTFQALHFQALVFFRCFAFPWVSTKTLFVPPERRSLAHPHSGTFLLCACFCLFLQPLPSYVHGSPPAPLPRGKLREIFLLFTQI